MPALREIGGFVRRSSRREKYLFILTVSLLYAVYGYVALTSYGFDDEFYNINLIEGRSVANAIAITQSSDVHPPLSYILNYYLYALLGSWSYVRLAIGALLISAIAWSSLCYWSREGWRQGMTTLMFMGFSPSVLMWGTSLRWYSLYLIFLVLLLTPLRARPGLSRSFSTHFRLVLFLLLLGYTGYITIVLAAPIALFYYLRDDLDWSIKHKLYSCVGSLIAFAILYSHQLFVFVNVHYPNGGNQKGSLVRALIGLITAEFSNQGLFPVSAAGIVAALSMGTILFMSLLTWIRAGRAFCDAAFIAYLLSLSSLVLSTLGVKFRNFVTIAPLRSIYLASVQDRTRVLGEPYIMITKFSLLLVLITQLWGVMNVISHKDTTKNNWNIPVDEALTSISNFSKGCMGQTTVLNHEDVFQWHLERQGYLAIGPYSRADSNPASTRSGCIVILNTYRGALDRSLFQSMRKEAFRLLEGVKYERQKLGLDRHYWLKQKIDPDFPKYSVEILTAKGEFDLSGLRSWAPSRSKD
jgi:hypothetical protein